MSFRTIISHFICSLGKREPAWAIEKNITAKASKKTTSEDKYLKFIYFFIRGNPNLAIRLNLSKVFKLTYNE